MRENPTVSLVDIEPDRLKGNERFTPERQKQRDKATERLFQYWRGDLHTHSAASSQEGWGYAEGIYSEEEIARYYQKLGLELVAFAEHPTKPGQPHRVEKRDLQAQAFLEQIKRVEKINKKPETKIAILSSAEVNIHFDQAGEPILDLPDQVLSKLDIVTASRHGIDQEKDIEAIKKSLLMAAKHPLVDTIGHPDRYIRLEGGITDQGEPCDPEKYWEAWEEILEEMAKNNKAFEINLNEKSRPADELLRRAAEKGLNFVLNFDAHDFDQYGKESTKTKQKWAKDEATEDDLAQLADYKKERLQAGPGLRAIRLLMNYLRKLEELGIGQSRIINSSRERLLEFLTEERGKQTDNLNNLKEKFENDQP